MTQTIYPKDALPWVGLYVCLASLVCTLAMAADAIEGFRQRKLWFPCRFFTINAATITLIAIAMKLPVDLSTDMDPSKSVGIIFLVIMLANFLPSLGLMDGKELLTNMIAFGILIITITVNVWLQYFTIQYSYYSDYGEPISHWSRYNISLIRLPMFMAICSLPFPFSVALTVPSSRKLLQHRYKNLHRLASSNHQEINFSGEGLIRYVRRYWMMAETDNPQFAVACSPISSAFGVICICLVCNLVYLFVVSHGWIFFPYVYTSFPTLGTEYRWSMRLILFVQSVGTIVGSIAPIFRCLTAISHFNLSNKWSVKHLNVFIIEKIWTQRLQLWKRSHVRSSIPGRHGKKVFHNIKNLILNICIGLQITVVVICKTISVIPRSFLILFSYCCDFCNSTLERFREPNASNSNVVPDIEEFNSYVQRAEVVGQLSENILRNSFNSITRILHDSEEKEPRYLLKLLNKSTGFYGVIEFDNGQGTPSHPEEFQNCWSLVAVTLTAIALSLPGIAHDHVKELLASMREGVQIVRHVEESLNTNGELVEARKAARHVWDDVEVYSTWLQIDLQKKARQGNTSGEILQWLGDEAKKIVEKFEVSEIGSLDNSLRNFIAASSMYRISQTILVHCNEQENWPTNVELLDRISTIIADLLLACFTNLPRVITLKCHANALEKREDSIRTAAQLLGKSKKILEILEKRRLPNLDLDSMAYIDKWHALPRSQIPNDCSSARIEPASSTSGESIKVIIAKERC